MISIYDIFLETRRYNIHAEEENGYIIFNKVGTDVVISQEVESCIIAIHHDGVEKYIQSINNLFDFL